MLLGLLTVPGHVVVVGGTGMLHFMDRLADVSADCIQVVPVVDSGGEGSAGKEGQTERGDYEFLAQMGF